MASSTLIASCKLQLQPVLQVHFDCMYKSLDVVSSRSARLLGANRSIAEVSQLDVTCLTMPSIGHAQVQWSALPMRLNVVITNIRLCNLSLCQPSQQHGKFVLFLQPVEFTAGLDVGSGGVKQPAGEGAGGLFSGASGPKPPAALSQAVLGMKPGGKVSETLITLMSFSLIKHWCVVNACLFLCYQWCSNLH